MATLEVPATLTSAAATSTPSLNGRGVATADIPPPETKPNITAPRNCFVCDVLVTTPKHYILATSRTQSTNIRLIEKLGQMVGDQYMVVICEDDIICRCCASLINTLDRLETELGSVRSAVLRFLEKKYSLEEGELVKNKPTGVGLPPQVTSRGENGLPENFMINKRKSVLAAEENRNGNEENISDLDKGKKDSKKDKKNVWMQCDKCKYTTRYNAFLLHHVRKHIQKSAKCDFCREPVKEGGYCLKKCVRNEEPEKVVVKQADQQTPQAAGMSRGITKVTGPQAHSAVEAETVEMIAAEISDMDIKPIPHLHEPICQITELRNPGAHQRNEEYIIPVTDMSKQQMQQGIAAGNLEVQIENEEESGPTAICVMQMAEEHTPNEPTLLVQKMGGDDGDAVYVQVVEVGKDDEGDGVPKVLTVSDDGTVEMVEVMWDDVVASQVSAGENMDF